MDLLEKIKAVEEEFQNLDKEISSFQSWSGLGCKIGCGKCCFKADIEATVLEFLPFAQHLHQQDQAFEWLEKIKTADTRYLYHIKSFTRRRWNVLSVRPSGFDLPIVWIFGPHQQIRKERVGHLPDH